MVIENTINQKIGEDLARVMPCNLVAEQMLLGNLLTDNELINKVSDFLLADHFFEPVHKRIYNEIIRFMDKGIVANPVTLKNCFDKDESLKDKGGAQYLFDLASLAATIINVTDYGKAIYDLALRRSLIHVGEDVVNDAYDKEGALSAPEQIEIAEQRLYNIADSYMQSNQGFSPIKVSLNNAINKAQQAFKNKGKVSGIATDFIDLDDKLGGLQDSDLIILAGRPAMGKTAIILNIALNCCKVLVRNFEMQKNELPDKTKNHRPKSVGFFSLEMSAEQIASRMISMMSGVNSSKLRTGHLNEEEFSQIVRGAKELQSLPFFIDDTPSLSISALRTRARRLKRQHNLGILFIDYLQLIRGSRVGKDINRVQEVSEITQGLKAIAKELNIPVVAPAQLSRAVEQREDKRPLLSDLRESGSIEQDADIVAFLYREEYYLMRKKPPKEGTEAFAEWQQAMSAVSNISEVIIAKHRNGPVGDIKLYFDPSLTRFTNYSQDYE